MIDRVVLRGAGPHDLPEVQHIRIDTSGDGEKFILSASFFNTDTQKMDMMHITASHELIQGLYTDIPDALEKATEQSKD